MAQEVNRGARPTSSASAFAVAPGRSRSHPRQGILAVSHKRSENDLTRQLQDLSAGSKVCYMSKLSSQGRSASCNVNTGTRNIGVPHFTVQKLAAPRGTPHQTSGVTGLTSEGRSRVRSVADAHCHEDKRDQVPGADSHCHGKQAPAAARKETNVY